LILETATALPRGAPGRILLPAATGCRRGPRPCDCARMPTPGGVGIRGTRLLYMAWGGVVVVLAAVLLTDPLQRARMMTMMPRMTLLVAAVALLLKPTTQGEMRTQSPSRALSQLRPVVPAGLKRRMRAMMPMTMPRTTLLAIAAPALPKARTKGLMSSQIPARTSSPLATLA